MNLVISKLLPSSFQHQYSLARELKTFKKKNRLILLEGNETVTNGHALKMLAPDGKMRLSDEADFKSRCKKGRSLVAVAYTSPKQFHYEMN